MSKRAHHRATNPVQAQPTHKPSITVTYVTHPPDQPPKLRWWKGWLKGAYYYYKYDRSDRFPRRAIGVLLYYLYSMDISAMSIEAIMNLIPGGQVVDVAYVPEAPSAAVLWLVVIYFMKVGKKVAHYRKMYWR